MRLSEILGANVLRASALAACAAVAISGYAFSKEVENVPLPATFDPDLSNLSAIIISQTRSPANRPHDLYEHPIMMFQFMEIQARDTVIEILSTDDYWAQMIGLITARGGKYVQTIDPSNQTAMADFTKLKNDSAVEHIVDYDVVALNADQLAPDNSVDIVFMSRKMGTLMRSAVLSKLLAAEYKVLKPGGVLVVEDYRAAGDKPQDPKAANDYIREDFAVTTIQAAGFKLATKEDNLLANVKDTRTKAGPNSDRFLAQIHQVTCEVA